MHKPNPVTNEILDSIAGLWCGARCCDHRDGRISLLAFPMGPGFGNIPALFGAIRKTVSVFGIVSEESGSDWIRLNFVIA